MERPPQVGLLRKKIIFFILEYFRLLNTLVDLAIAQNEDENYSMLQLLSLETLATERTSPMRVKNYIDSVIPGQTAKQFQENFRLSLGTFEALLSYVGPRLISASKFCAVSKIMNPRKQLLAVLWILATPDSYRSVAERFDMGKSSLHNSFMFVVKVINSFSKKIIKWPQGQTAINAASKFQRSANIPGVIGAIDGTYIQINAPEICSERYINRKCFYAITLQAVCDASLKFSDVFTGYPSSVSDRRIFNNSDLYRNVLGGTITFPRDCFIIGDKAYPVLSWCIPPYIERGTLSSQEKKFNTAHAKTRSFIERSFALLKGRFRRLKYLDMPKTEFIPMVILACCVLHNICLTNENEALIELYIQEGTDNVVGEHSTTDAAAMFNNPIEEQALAGAALRNRLMLSIN